jgi:hypothetical protein
VSRASVLRLVAIALVLAAALTAVAVGGFALRPSAPAAVLDDPVTVKRALSTTAALFGDPVVAEVDVVSRDADVPAVSVRVATTFAPLTVISTKVDRARLGGASLLRTTVMLQCLSRACLPPAGGRLVQLRPIVVTYAHDGAHARTVIPWHPLQISSRLPQGADGIGVIDTAPPLDPGFARSPTTVRAVLLLATALLLLGGAALVVSALWPASLRGRRQWAKLSPLERSLRLVEAAAGGADETERRRTLDQLALRLGDAQSPQLEGQTRALAWGQAPPEPRDLTMLAAKVRATLNGKVQG